MPEKEKARINFWGGNPDEFLPNISIDCVIFGFHEGILKILLTKFDEFEKWMLPGGFVSQNIDIDEAASHVLYSRTRLDNIYLRQFHTFGKSTRTNENENKELIDKIQNSPIAVDIEWFTRRYVSIGYLALVEYSKVEIAPLPNQKVEWFEMKDIQTLYSDHNEIIEKAIEYITININSVPIGSSLLPEKFTMTELRTIYESILDRKLDRRNFQRKILSSGHVVRLKEMEKKPGVKPATLFTFDMEKYNKGYSMFE